MDASGRTWRTSSCGRWCVLGVSILSCMVLSLVACLGAAHRIMTAPAISPSDEARLHSGMTRDEVRGVLGTPSDVSWIPGGGERWLYGSATWAAYQIEFDGNGRVDMHWHDY